MIEIHFESQIRKISESEIQRVVEGILADYDIRSSEIGVIFIDDNYITDLNIRYFDKNRPTDVISFPLSDENTETLEGEIYVSTETAKIQADEYQVSWENELMRLVIHGLLHILGLDDQTAEEREKMTSKEDYYLKTFYNTK